MTPYSQNYEKQVADLADWFKTKIADLADIDLKRADFQMGTDSLQEPYKSMVRESFNVWLNERNYELSYNQVCRAFFQAAKDLGKLKVDGVPVGRILGGTFIRVKADHHNSARAGKDGMVFEDCEEGSESIALVFGQDRHNQAQGCECVGPELWLKTELDMVTAF